MLIWQLWLGILLLLLCTKNSIISNENNKLHCLKFAFNLGAYFEKSALVSFKVSINKWIIFKLKL